MPCKNAFNYHDTMPKASVSALITNSNLPIPANSKTPTPKFTIPQTTLISGDAPIAGGEAKGECYLRNVEHR